MCGLLVAGNYKKDGAKLIRLLLAAMLIGSGVLTKNTMIFAIPLLGYLAWLHGRNQRESLILTAASLILTLSIVAGYQVAARVLFPEDTAYFAQLNLDSRMHESVYHWLTRIPHVIFAVKSLGTSFVLICTLMTLTALFISDWFRRHPFTHILIGYICLYVGVLTLVSYSPPRYYLPLIVPLSVLCAISCLVLTKSINESKWKDVFGLSVTPFIMVVGLLFSGSWQITSYLSKPSYSFHQMAQEVGNIIEKREGRVADVVLFGTIADSVSIESGTFPVNAILGTNTLDWKLKTFRPRYLILNIDEGIVEAVELNGGHVEKLASWDVYGNYYGNGQQVKLMHVVWD